ncbi:MAG: hypothetical protein QXS54_00430 [Candidatus Methanomethylicaceae archaeon]
MTNDVANAEFFNLTEIVFAEVIFDDCILTLSIDGLLILHSAIGSGILAHPTADDTVTSIVAPGKTGATAQDKRSLCVVTTSSRTPLGSGKGVVVGVGEIEGVKVIVGVPVTDGVGVTVGVMVIVGVAVNEGVRVGVWVGVAVRRSISIGCAGVGVGDGVGV